MPLENMNDNQRLQLQNMIKANNVEDQTDLIRKLKHSEILRNDVNSLIMLKAKYRNEPEQINQAALVECPFLYTYYTEIFNKVKKDEIDLAILFNFFDILRKVEDGELDQHEGSFAVGNILKKIYIDSALKKANKLNEEHDKNNPKPEPKEAIDISWKHFKKMTK